MQRHTRAIAAQLLGQAALGHVPGSGPRFLVVSGPDAGRSLPITDGDTVGRGPSAQVPLRDPSASRQHLRIERRGGDLAIRDLGSKNGVELNGRRVRARAALRDGDRVRVGATVLEAAGVAVRSRGCEPSPAGASTSAAPTGLDVDGHSPPSSGVIGRRHLLRAGAAMLLVAGAALVAAGS
jgi:S-DNA-T family DNA segregation ATPase FtsK/SpoIIIE